ncbi:hypothetical protein PFISCL1PPCAC_12265, partial [Pristionchus fissidentatus]
SLASHSSFFKNLFFGGYKEKNDMLIEIKEVEYKDFDNLLRLMYCYEGQSLRVSNVELVLQLAIRFDVKIVEDRAV